jgi:hypothetical protein
VRGIFLILHCFPLPKMEKAESTVEFHKSSPPFEKGRTGGIFGKAFSEDQHVISGESITF